MTLTQIRNAVNARLATLWPAIMAKQENYFAAKSAQGTPRYWQGLLFATPPDDGALCTPDMTLKAGNENTTWQTALNGDIPGTIEAAFRIDTYEAPGGVHGYYCTCLVTKTGVTYGRTAQVENGVEITTGSWQIVT